MWMLAFPKPCHVNRLANLLFTLLLKPAYAVLKELKRK
jgi:hypothetical protein